MTQLTVPQSRQKFGSLLAAFSTRLHYFLTGSDPNGLDFRTLFWLALSLAVSAYFANHALHQAFSSQYVVQDDARQHVFWMERFLDPQLFPRDLIADYFQSVAPSGYSAFYNVMAKLGIDPLLLNKLLPMVLGLITTTYCFGVCLQMLPAPAAAFLSSLLLNQSLWMQDDLVSATPRAFLYPIFLAFLYYLSRGSVLPCLAAIALQGLFYPSIGFIMISILILRLLDWQKEGLRLSRDRRNQVLCAAGLGIFLLIIVFYARKSSGFGPVVTASEARTLPEFSTEGRIRFFHPGFWSFWLTGINSGMTPMSSLLPITICSGFLLPVLLRYPKRLPLVKQISRNISLLPQVALSSVLLFVAAHLLLFKLYLPNRYTQHSIRIILSLASGITLIVILDAVFHWSEQRPGSHLSSRYLLAIGSTALLAIALFEYPGSPRDFIRPNYRVGRESQLYEFFSQQPKDILIASLSGEASKVPVFSKRSNLVSWECSLPFHRRYHGEIRRRAIDLINAQYSPDLSELRGFIQKYGIDFFLVDRHAFTPDYVASDKLMLMYQPAANEAMRGLERGDVPALSTLMQKCSGFEDDDFIVVKAECVMKASPE